MQKLSLNISKYITYSLPVKGIAQNSSLNQAEKRTYKTFDLRWRLTSSASHCWRSNNCFREL